MADKPSEENPVYKITIQRESPVKGGEPKYKLVPENFTLGSPAAPTVSVTVPTISLPENVVCTSLATQPVFSGRAYVKCAVPNCFNYFDGERNEFMGISYFPFPQDPELRQEWIKAIELPPDKNPDQLKVCSDHFVNQDFVTDYIEIEDVPEEARKPQENVELRPNAKPTVKLGSQSKGNEKMADFAKETWEKNVKTYGNSRGSKRKFEGLDNPLMDTANEVRSSTNPTMTSQPNAASPDDSSEPLIPVITSVGTIHPIGTDPPGKSQKDIDRERADKLGTVVDVMEVEDEADEYNAMLARKTPKTTTAPKTVVPENVDVEPAKEEQGLINVPASVRLPPRRTITGEISTTTALPTRIPELVPSSSAGKTLPGPSDDVAPSTSAWPPESTTQRRTRRKRRTREEMRRCEEEEDWEPTIAIKKTLEKEGFDFEPKRRTQKSGYSARGSSTKETTDDDDDDDDDEFDEGFRIDEPVATRSQGSSVKRRPGPASKTRRPRYVPSPDNPSQSDPEKSWEPSTSDGPSKNEGPDIEEVLSDKSLLVDWSFFKSLIPDLGRMSREKRLELKTFMLDTLNARIYEGQPIIPSCANPVNS